MTVPQATPSEPISTIETKQETLSIVVPAYNEELVIAEFHRRISAVLDEINLPAEIIYINDGSKDKTSSILLELRKKRSQDFSNRVKSKFWQRNCYDSRT